MLYNMEDAVAYSFKNFHAKGLHYICVKRSPIYTLKYYIYDGKPGRVVNPHDHRYDFRTTVLAGQMFNQTFMRHAKGTPHRAFDFYTPLLGGEGFVEREPDLLIADTPQRLEKYDTLTSVAKSIHTIHVAAGTILQLEQFYDVVDEEQPTSCWSPVGSPPPSYSDDGIYDKFTADEIVKYLTLITEETGEEFTEIGTLKNYFV